jgi:transposase
MVQDLDFLTTVLGLKSPWRIVCSELDLAKGVIEAEAAYEGPVICPTCNQPAGRYDHRERRWRHLDLFQYEFYLTARIPRVNCSEHGVVQLPVPWANGLSGFTSLFERMAIELLLQMSITAVAKQLRVSWDEIDGIMERAVKRGLQRRQSRVVRYIGIDEKATKKGHNYFTVVSDLEAGVVLWIGRGRKKETLNAFWAGLSVEQLAGIEGIAMDMWLPYFESTIAHVPGAASKIVFDKFHITSYLTKAVDQTRRWIMRDPSIDRDALKGTKYWWLRNPRGMDRSKRREFAELRSRYTKLARAWAIKESFAEFWQYRRESSARSFFAGWFGWATRSQIPAVIDVAYTIKRHFANIITYLKIPITNAAAEGINSKIQMIKYRARGYRNEGRFERAILFHCGALDLYPTHSNS